MEEKVIVEENNETKDTKTLVKKILVIVGNVAFYAVIILLFLFSLMNINAGNGTKNFPNLFGKGMLSVQSSSMERLDGGYHPEEWDSYKIKDIKKGDLVNATVFKQSDFKKLKVGDVITFYDSTLNALNTHRIVRIGDSIVYTQGDYIISTSQDYYYPLMTNEQKYQAENDHNVLQVVNSKDIRGIVTSVKRGSGKTLDNIRSNWLFYFVIPVAVILIAEIFFVFKNFMDLKKEKSSEALGDEKAAMLAELEAEKEKMRQELLAELRKEQMKESTTVEEPVKEEDKESSNDDNSPEEE